MRFDSVVEDLIAGPDMLDKVAGKAEECLSDMREIAKEWLNTAYLLGNMEGRILYNGATVEDLDTIVAWRSEVFEYNAFVEDIPEIPDED
jgi:hypothetical protein